tara:strand:+ start:103 stop:516 length:414 start_codon:yes stop_codon:yes gene_type:complete
MRAVLIIVIIVIAGFLGDRFLNDGGLWKGITGETAAMEAAAEEAAATAAAEEAAATAAAEEAAAAEAAATAEAAAAPDLASLLTPEGFDAAQVLEMVQGSDLGAIAKTQLMGQIAEIASDPSKLPDVLAAIKEALGM